MQFVVLRWELLKVRSKEISRLLRLRLRQRYILSHEIATGIWTVILRLARAVLILMDSSCINLYFKWLDWYFMIICASGNWHAWKLHSSDIFFNKTKEMQEFRVIYMVSQLNRYESTFHSSRAGGCLLARCRCLSRGCWFILERERFNRNASVGQRRYLNLNNLILILIKFRFWDDIFVFFNCVGIAVELRFWC